MDPLSLKFNKMIMEEIGLEVGARQCLYDQDTGCLVQLEGKDLVAPGASSGKEAQEFDPYNSTRMMSQIFGYYTRKLAESGEAPEYGVVYNVDCGKGLSRVEIKNDEEKLSSKPYMRDQCKYADLILQINGDENPDLKEFDVRKEPLKKSSIKAAPRKKK